MIPKFRVFNKSFGEWLDAQEIVLCEGELFRDWIRFEDGIPLNMRDCAVMQSTGLKDKNDVEIFEGDVVKNSKDEVGYIAFLQQEAGFVVILKKSDYRIGHRNTGESYSHAMGHEVIGNIYENPELLEAE